MNFTETQRRRVALGFSLVELLVALAIGSFLIAGAVTIYSRSRNSFTVNEQNARLQETARYVLSVMEPELQSAGMFGFSNRPEDFFFRAAGVERAVAQLRGDDPALAAVGADAHECGDNFPLDLLNTIQGSENSYTLGCAAEGAGAVADTDTVTIRRASTDAVAAADATRLQIQTNRLQPNRQSIFLAAAAPDSASTVNQLRDLVVATYYVAQQSETNPNVPALRVKQLAAGPTWDDQEVIRGVEDLQVQFGIDTGEDLNGDGAPDDEAGDGVADFVSGFTRRYVNPDDPLLASAQVTSVRFWVRVRSDDPEPGFVDNRNYVYGTTDFTPNDNFRRVLVSRTVYLRNARSGETFE
jgi:type IV pilus assembly protein PilW